MGDSDGEGSVRLDPEVVGGGQDAGIAIAGVAHATGFDEHEVDFVLGEGFMLDTFRDDVEFARVEDDDAIAEVYAELALQDEEGFVRVGVIVPDEVAL